MARVYTILFFLAALISLATATAPTFCKCTCFKNSTIISLDDESSSSESENSLALLRRTFVSFDALGHDTEIGTRARSSGPCAGCTKSFCLGRGLDICEKAEEDDVTTMCFQRDSNQDKIIVWAFIITTFGLLGWASGRRILAWRRERAFGQQNAPYAPVSGGR